MRTMAGERFLISTVLPACIALLALAFLMVSVSTDDASAATEGDLVYELENGKAVITGTTLTSASALEIPDTLGGYPLRRIDEGAFADCPYVTAFDATGDSNPYSDSGGVLFSDNQLILYPAGSTAASYSIPAGTTRVAPYAFAGSVNLECVSFPSGLNIIQKSAFSNCASLTSVTFSSANMSSIAERAFEGCSSLGSISLPTNLSGLGKYAFSGCTSLTSITLPGSIGAIPEGLLYGCEGLTYLNVPASVNTVLSDAFNGCLLLGRLDFACTGAMSFDNGSLKVGVPGNSVTVNLNCTSPGLVPSTYSDGNTSFVLNQTDFRISLYSDSVLYKEYIFKPGADVILDDVPTKTGYTIKWTPAVPEKMTVGDIVTYGTWVPDTYDIVYVSGDESYKQTVTYGGGVPLTPLQFVRYDKIFQHWKDGGDNIFAEDAYADDSLMYNAGEGTTLTAVWADPAFIVRYLPDGASGTMNDLPVAQDVSTRLTANAFTRTGYIFDHWSWNGNTYENAQYVLNLATDGSVLDFTAVWNPIRYTVNYELEGGSGQVAPRLAYYDESFELPGQLVSRPGYALAGWSLTQGSGTVDYEPSARVFNLSTVDGATIELYAVWTQAYLIISFDANGGTGTMPNQSILSGQTEKLSACTFQSEYAFLGWAKTPAGPVEYLDSQEMTFSGSAFEQMTLYAVWDKPAGGGSDHLVLIGSVIAIVAVLGCMVAAVSMRR